MVVAEVEVEEVASEHFLEEHCLSVLMIVQLLTRLMKRVISEEDLKSEQRESPILKAYA